MCHHDNHAYLSYGVSPFNRCKDPVMVTVLDGYGDNGSISLYVAQDNKLRCIRNERERGGFVGCAVRHHQLYAGRVDVAQ